MFINLPLEITSYPLRFIEKHYILLFIITKIEIISCCCLVAQSCLTLCDPHGLQHTRLPCPSLSPAVCSNSYPLRWWCHSTISSSVSPFSSCPQSFPAPQSFPGCQLFASNSQPQHQSFQCIFRVDLATYPSILAWGTPRTQKPGGLQSMGLQSQTQLTDSHTQMYSYLKDKLCELKHSIFKGITNGFERKAKMKFQT